jgi:hypothetical protein
VPRRALVIGQFRDAFLKEDDAVVVPALLKVVDERLLVHDDVRLVVVQVVERPQLVAEEARRICNREHPSRLQVIYRGLGHRVARRSP